MNGFVTLTAMAPIFLNRLLRRIQRPSRYSIRSELGILYSENKSLIFADDSIAGKYDVVIPEHTTPHGSREIYVRDSAGNLVGIVQQGNL